MAAVHLAFAAMFLLVAPIHSEGDPGRDPCKTTNNGFGLTCSNITSQFFSSVMFYSLNDDIARFTNEMKRLDIQQSNVTHLQSGSFKRMPLLTYLIMSNVSLREIERGAFEGLTKLKMADLSYNEIETIPVDTFKDTRISHLNLEGNPNLQIPTNGPLLNAKRLRSLILKGCNLRHLPGSAFAEIVHLSHLDLSQNHLDMLPRDLFSPLEHLDFLDLSGNRFQTLGMDPFKSIPNFPGHPSAIALADNPWRCDCRLADLIRWAVPGRLRRKTYCRDPENVKGLSWKNPKLKEVISGC